MPRYDAFISYSRDADLALASSVHQFMERYGRSWRKRRALRIFRDDTGLVPGLLWHQIETELAESRYLVLFASPQAAMSKWVGREVEWWLDNKSADTLLVALTAGSWTWNDQLRDFEAGNDQNPIPNELRGRLDQEPFYADLTQTRSLGPDTHAATIDTEDRNFLEPVVKIAARVHGKAPNDLMAQDLEEHERGLRIRRTAIASIVTLLVGLVGLGSVVGDALATRSAAESEAEEATAEAQTERERAESQEQRADSEQQGRLARELSLRALRANDEAPDLRILMAVAADRLDSSGASHGAMLRALLETPNLSGLLPGHTGGVVDLKRSSNGSVYATVDGTGAVRSWSERGPLLAGPIDARSTEILLSANGEIMVSIDRAGATRWLSTEEGKEFYKTGPPNDATPASTCDVWGCGRVFAGISPDGRTVALGLSLPDGRDIVRFVGPERPMVDVGVGEQLTGLLWHGRDPLFVADLNGIERWNGDRGPASSGYIHKFGAYAGLVPGMADYKDNPGPDSPLSDPALAIVTLTTANDHLVDFIGLNGERLGTTSAVGMFEGLYNEAPLGAIASTWPGQVWMATDPELGGEPIPVVIDAAIPSYRGRQRLWNVPEESITRLAAGDDLAVAVAGLDPVVRVVGGPHGPVRYSSEEMETAPIPRVDRITASLLPEAVEDGRRISVSVEPPNHAYAAALYSQRGRGFADPPEPEGPLRVVDEDGADITPAHLQPKSVSALAIDGERSLLFTGSRSGSIEISDLATGELLDSSRVFSRPVTGMILSWDGNFLIAITDEEAAILDPTTLGIVKVLTALETSVYRSDTMFITPSQKTTGFGFDEAGNLWFGWYKSAGTEVGFGGDPFGVDEEVGTPWLPGIDTHSDYAPSVVLMVSNLAERACDVANRDLSMDEWDQLAPGVQRPAEVCPDHPLTTPSTAPLLERYQEGFDPGD